MMKKLFLLVLLFILISCEYERENYFDDNATTGDVDIIIPEGKLNEYQLINSSDVIIEGKGVDLPDKYQNMSDIELAGNAIATISQLFGEGFLRQVCESLGLDIDGFFDSSDVTPRAVVAEASFHAVNEGVYIKKDGDTVSTADIQYLDMFFSGACNNLARFIFRMLDSSEWPYNQRADGSVGLSFKGNITPTDTRGEKLAISAFTAINTQNFLMDYLVVNEQKILFPFGGQLNAKLKISLASSVLTIAESHNTASGYPVLDGSEYTEYFNYHCPFSINIDVKDTLSFDCRKAFYAIRDLLMNYNSISRYENWQKLCEILWEESGGEYIVVSIEIPDIGNGESRSIRMHDLEIIQFLLPS